MPDQDRLIVSSRLVVRGALILNRVLLLSFATGLCLTGIFSTQFAAMVSRSNPAGDATQERLGLRLLILIGIAMSAASNRLFVALGEVIASASTGDPFIPANARRLQTIGFALLGLQLLYVPATLLDRYFPSLGSAAPNASFSIGGWIGVLMVFVLSRVFAAGSAMRDDLEGTV